MTTARDKHDKEVEVRPGKLICVHLKRFTIDEKLNYKVSILKDWNGYNLIGMCNHFGSLRWTLYIYCENQFRLDAYERRVCEKNGQPAKNFQVTLYNGV